MPKPYYGEAAQLIDAGEYDAVITHVINLGHQTFKDREITKFWIEFWIPSLNESKPLSNFGISSWLSPSKPPFVGFYELISAVTSNPLLTQNEAKAYDVFQLAGKSVKIVFTQNEKGFMNITGVQHSDEALVAPEEPITVGVEDFGNTELLDKIPEKARNLIWFSREQTGTVSNDVYETVQIKGDDESQIALDQVPF